jgi:hypothetical protein
MVLLADADYVAYGVLLAMVVAIWLLLRWTQRSVVRSQTATRPRFAPKKDSEPDAPSPREEPPIDFNRWEVEMYEIMRNATGQLDTKMGLLEHLIREADRAAARLEAATAAASRSSDPMTPGSNAPDWPRFEPPPMRPISQAEGLRPDALRHGPTPTDEETDRPGKPRRYEEIYTLADYGYCATEIAQRIAVPVGEIELILGLRPRR